MQQILLAVLLSFGVAVLLGPILIPMLKRLKFGQTVRDDGPKTHLVKSGTPTMGGLMILAGILAGTLAFSMSGMDFVLPALLATFAFGIVGFFDDFIKIRKKRSLGLKAYQKILAQLGISFIIALYAYKQVYIGSSIYVPFANINVDLGIWYIPFVMFVMIAIVNAVNLTDGLDGLASGVSMIYSFTMMIIFMIIAYIAMNEGAKLQAENLRGMAVFSAAVTGACLGFLRYNAYPAQVFMGDTGSLALGGALGMMAVFSRAILLLPVMGICFVASAVSVVLQVGSYKLRKKRIFKMAPLHHHFELKGVPETKIVSMYMIITAVFCMICLLAYVPMISYL
ncbi:phospho-N-acetylmuramoyl-pentapeptide-transferase [Christensenellaceae bacterium OttesenSCG-928-M15]|nr:phospho-N-acetylmuramoyl-pentapeptide-transferase [Christensenellaceae bacterium OttesenSCG-928-M15]